MCFSRTVHIADSVRHCAASFWYWFLRTKLNTQSKWRSVWITISCCCWRSHGWGKTSELHKTDRETHRDGLIVMSVGHLPVRRIWLKPRSQIFWEETCQDWQEKDWNENFRMSKKAFNRLCRELSPHISKMDTNYRKAITGCHRVAITRLTLERSEIYLVSENPLFVVLCDKYARW